METGKKMTDRQRGAIFALGKTAGLDNDALHDVVRRVAGVSSLTLLSERAAMRVIDELKRTVGQGETLGWLTGAQRGKLFALCRELGWLNGAGAIDVKRLEGFIRARFGIDRITWLTREKGGAVIEALKKMSAGGRGERNKKADGMNSGSAQA